MSDIPEVTPSASAVPAKTPVWLVPLVLICGVVALVALALAWQSQSRQSSLEQELVRRQEASQIDAAQARLVARQAQDVSRDTAAKVSLLDDRLAEVALQRSQLEDLIQSMSRSRDENMLGDIESSLRVAMQQSQITGSAEPLVAALRQADERLQRYKEPRLEGVRRAVARDLDRVKAVSLVDVSTLTIRLDEVTRQLDDLPLLSEGERAPVKVKPVRVAASSAAHKPPPEDTGRIAQWWASARQHWNDLASAAWSSTHDLVRVTRIDHPEAMLIAPEQSYFLRENLKLRLLNARLALLSRQFDTAQADLRQAQEMLGRYFDSRSHQVIAAASLLHQVEALAHQVDVPRPDDTLAALAAAGR